LLQNALDGNFERNKLDQTKLCLKITHKSSDPKKITQAIVNFVFGNPMHNKSYGLEGKERFGYC
jgi:hypothetical protein